MKATEVTQSNFDKSQILKELLKSEWHEDCKQLFGELQFAFVGFMLGESMTCFEHWKKLVMMVCSADEASRSESAMYLEFIRIIFDMINGVAMFYGQLKQLPDDFFADALTGNSFLKVALQNLYEFLADPATDPKLRKRSEKLFKLLKDQFKFEPNRETELSR